MWRCERAGVCILQTTGTPPVITRAKLPSSAATAHGGRPERKTLDLPESSAATVDEPVPWEVLS